MKNGIPDVKGVFLGRHISDLSAIGMVRGQGERFKGVSAYAKVFAWNRIGYLRTEIDVVRGADVHGFDALAVAVVLLVFVGGEMLQVMCLDPLAHRSPCEH